tara:strand:- start:1710 stop:2549 length:840 start_codon:yes stop_codon:yes gene_type:complete
MNHGEMADKILESELPALQKVILLGYLKHRNKKTGLAWPGSKTLARYASTSRQVVMRHRAELIEKGWLVVVKQVPGKSMVVSIRHQGGASPAPQVVPFRHPNLPNEPTKEPKKEIADMLDKELRESWDQWNAIRKELDPKYRRHWKYETWSDQWKACFKKQHTVDEVLGAFRYFWTSDDTKWWRTNRPRPSSSFLNSQKNHLSDWIEGAKDSVEEQNQESDNREDTSSFVLCRLWVRRNRPQIEMAMRNDTLQSYLEEQVTHVDSVMKVLGRSEAAGGK